jgi:hypothetical protein
MTAIEAQAREILNSLVQRPFSACIPISRDFAGLTTKPGIYAMRHRIEGFRGGHKAITWSWLEDYDHRDVAIATSEINYQQWRALSSDLEGIILIWSKPPFNIRIPMRDEL